LRGAVPFEVRHFPARQPASRVAMSRLWMCWLWSGTGRRGSPAHGAAGGIAFARAEGERHAPGAAS
jgi:L-ascorbate metabolism protein UlaG (beta-lactamase superfamily)